MTDKVSSVVAETCAATPYACSPRKKTLLPSGNSSERGGASFSKNLGSSELTSNTAIWTACSVSFSGPS